MTALLLAWLFAIPSAPADEAAERVCAVACMQAPNRQCCFYSCVCRRGDAEGCKQVAKACGGT